MKLIFTKNDNNEVDVQLQKGTVIEDFSYTEMISQLLVKNDFDDAEFDNLSEGEESRIKNMLDKVSDVFKEETDIEE